MVGIDHPGFNKTVRFPDGRPFEPDTLTMPKPTNDFRADVAANWGYLGEFAFPTWIDDSRFVLDRLERLNAAPGPLQGRLDLERVGAFGWSFGGAAAVELSRADPRIKAAVDQDGQLFGKVREVGTSRPFMLLHGGGGNESSQAPANDTSSRRAMMRELVATVRAFDSVAKARSTADWYDVRIAKATHGHFSDLTLFYPRDTVSIDPRRAHTIINAYTLAFFDQYLRDKPSPLLEGTSSTFPEVTFRRKSP